MLEIRLIVDSAATEVFGTKCCNLRFPDANLELHVTNRGEESVVVQSHLDLEGDHGTKRIVSLFPGGEQRIEPGRTMAFYCYVDEELWQRSQSLVLEDERGGRHRASIGESGCGD